MALNAKDSGGYNILGSQADSGHNLSTDRHVTEECLSNTDQTQLHEGSVQNRNGSSGQIPPEPGLTRSAERNDNFTNSIKAHADIGNLVDLSDAIEDAQSEPSMMEISASERTLMPEGSTTEQDVVAVSEGIYPRIKPEISSDDVIDLTKWPWEIVDLVDDDIASTSEVIVVSETSKSLQRTDASASEPIIVDKGSMLSATTNDASPKRVLFRERKPMTATIREKRLQIQRELVRRHQASQRNHPVPIADTSLDAQSNVQSPSIPPIQQTAPNARSQRAEARPARESRTQHQDPTLTADHDTWRDEELDPFDEFQAALPRAKAAKAAFEEEKRAFKRKERAGKTTREEEIAFLGLERQEQIRQKRLDDLYAKVMERASNTQEASDDDGLFIPMQRKTGSDVHQSPRPEPAEATEIDEAPKHRRRKKQSNKVSEEAIAAGLEGERIKEMRRAKKGRGSGTTKSSKKASGRKTKADKVSKPGKKGRSHPKSLFRNFNSLFTSNVYADGNQNHGITLPTSSLKNKRKALNEIIAMVPLEDKRTVTRDKNDVLEASRKLAPRHCRLDPSGDWKLTGMRSLLRPHQVLAAAAMKEREDGFSQPAGGILADEMGFGKTVTTIATIIANPPPKNDKCKTTLVVVPTSILWQWHDELCLHAERERLGTCLIYHSSQKLSSFGSEEVYKRCDVILTTYGEVIASYPKFSPPPEIITFDKKREWFKRELEQNRGLLHRINFYRIVLDEAQAIKNHLSQTSKAVRALEGRCRWLLSGTPLQNSVEELYPYFKFLRVKYSGSFDVFRKNFCERDSDICNARVQALLKTFMIRRGHLDLLMGQKIVSLPDNHQVTFSVEFNRVERFVYEAVRKRFIERINSYSQAGNIKLRYNNILTMLLVLRELCSHLYLIQDTIQDIFLLEDFEKLWSLTADEVATTDRPASRDILIDMCKRLQNQSRGTTNAEPRDPVDEATDQILQYNRPLVFRFRQNLRELAKSENFAELRARSICSKCRDAASEPWITACGHLYCGECLRSMQYESAVRGEDQMECLACGSFYGSAEECPALKELGFDVGSPRSQNDETQVSTKQRSPKWIDKDRPVTPSSKAAAVLAQITTWLNEDPACKIVVFTQFRSMITVLGSLCGERGWGYCVFHGGQNHQSRNNVIKDFREKKETQIMIASLKCGGVGLNLTMANRVICIDPWWNSPVEQQAFCRVYRIGQTQETYITRIVVKDTVDDKLLSIQAEKTERIEAAYGDENGKRMAKLSVKELLRLFGTLSDDNDDEDGPDFIIVEDEPDETTGFDESFDREQPAYEDAIMLD